MGHQMMQPHVATLTNYEGTFREVHLITFRSTDDHSDCIITDRWYFTVTPVRMRWALIINITMQSQFYYFNLIMKSFRQV